MYGTIKTPIEFEEYVSLNQLDETFEIEYKPRDACRNYVFFIIFFVCIFLVILYFF